MGALAKNRIPGLKKPFFRSSIKIRMVFEKFADCFRIGKLPPGGIEKFSLWEELKMKSETKKKIAGLLLVILGIVYMILLGREDATAGVMLILMGAGVIVCKEVE